MQKVAELTAQGRMRPAGLAAFEARDREKTAIYSYEREAAALTDDETGRIRANKAAWSDWQRRPPSYRKTVTYWVVSAKKQETRDKRVSVAIDKMSKGNKRPCCFDRSGMYDKSLAAPLAADD